MTPALAPDSDPASAGPRPTTPTDLVAAVADMVVIVWGTPRVAALVTTMSALMTTLRH
ncbi:hypothetical protein ACWGLC_00235 [Dietzia sp. NPDC055877]